MDAFNIIFCLQVDLGRGHGLAALHADAAADSFHCHGGVLGGALYIALQVDVAAFRIGILYSDAAFPVATAQKAHGDLLVRRQREGVGLGRTHGLGPGGVVLGIGPQGIPVAAFCPAVSLGIGLVGLPVVPHDTEF